MNTRQIRRERFAQLMSTGMSAAEAFRKAGFHPPKNESSARVASWKMAQIMAPRIQELIGASPELISKDTKQVLEDSIEAFRRDVPWCREKLHEMINDRECADYVRLTAIRACLARGLDLPIQYVEQNLNVRYQISDQPMSEEEWGNEVGAITYGPGTEPKTEH